MRRSASSWVNFSSNNFGWYASTESVRKVAVAIVAIHGASLGRDASDIAFLTSDQQCQVIRQAVEVSNA
jgi:hypothetical protein